MKTLTWSHGHYFEHLLTSSNEVFFCY